MTIKKINTSWLTVKRTKWMPMSFFLAVALCFPQQDAGAGQEPVNLGSADSFAVLAATTVTSTSGGTINGDVGVWTGSTFDVGDPPVRVNGAVHLADPVAARAQADLAPRIMTPRGGP